MEIILSIFAEFNKRSYIRLCLLKNRLFIETANILYLAKLTFLLGVGLTACLSLSMVFGSSYIHNKISFFSISFPLICIAFISYLLMLIFGQTHRYKKMSILLYIWGSILFKDWNRITENARIFGLIISATIPVALASIIILMMFILHDKGILINYLAPLLIIAGLIWAKFISKLLEWKLKNYFSPLVLSFFTIVFFLFVTIYCIKNEVGNVYANILTTYGYYEYLKNYKNELAIYFQKSYSNYKRQLCKELFIDYRIERKSIINGRNTFNNYSQREKVKFFLILGLSAAVMVMIFYFISPILSN